MKTFFFMLLLLFSALTIAQDLTENYSKIILNSPDNVSLFQSNSTSGIWASGMIMGDRWGIFEDATSAKERLTILSGGNVGIGTTNPGSKLHVQFSGEGGITSKAISNGTYGAANIIVDAANGFPGRFLFREDGQNKGWMDYYSGKINLKNANGISLFTVLTANGDVGIGTSNPDAKLAVNGDIHTREVRVDLMGWPDYVFTEDYDLPTLKEV